MSGTSEVKHAHFQVPRGLPGQNAVPADEAIGTYLGAQGSVTNAAVSAVVADAPVYNVRVFGASPSKTAAENQGAIQTALNAAGLNPGTVYVPPGVYLHNDAFVIPSGVHLRGAGRRSVLKADVLASGGTGIGHRQIDATGKTGFRISDLMLDASGMTVFTTGMRAIHCVDSTQYAIERVHAKTPGAAVASIGCSFYVIDRVSAEVSSTTGAALHDGVIDQWGGSHDFQIINPVIHGGGISKYPILVTGETTANVAAACYNFTITGAQVYAAKLVGIWVNGRKGVNHTFTITAPLVDGVSDYFGIAISDSADWSLVSPVVKNTGSNGIRVYSETSSGGTVGGRNATITGPLVENANLLASASSTEGAAILVAAGCTGVVVSGARVKGTAHTYAATWSTTITACAHVAGSYDAGTLGKTLNDPAGGSFTPTVTGVANVASATAGAITWRRSGDLITVSGRVTVTPTAAASAATRVGVTLPVASDLASASTDLFGVGGTQFGVVAAISADIANDRAEIQFPAASTGANVVYFTFSYRAL
ncbi:glycosyl hydrolase family 28-related protein [Microbacterium sp. WCS2018Hpa-9]|uniref:glycosyl hydrolase family 28-related protein n=1 Tax=Microbacterium sp. WCS2018Hpa-9 TaxID=3073635 RepID=UPI00288BBEF6|nr:glycosyl hydrolase family 28-related protein [Microbacterium sp. WCS2018Hpa-9]